MKRFFFSVLLSLFGFYLWAQSPDSFCSYEDMVGQEVAFYGTQSCFELYGPFAYYQNGNNYKVIKDETEYSAFNAVPVRVTNIISWRKKRFLEINTTLNTYYLLLDGKANLLPISRSISYWRKQFSDTKSKYSYIHLSSPLFLGQALGTPATDDYLFITWNSIKIPATVNGAVYYECNINGHPIFLTQDVIDANPSSFASVSEYEIAAKELAAKRAAEKREQERRDSLADRTKICEALILRTNESAAALKKVDENFDYSEYPDTLVMSVYGVTRATALYKVDKYLGIVLGEEIGLSPKSLLFKDQQAKSYIEHRGDRGLNIRKSTAIINDRPQIDKYKRIQVRRTQELMARLEAVDKFCKQKKLFLLSRDYSYSDYQFGLKFEIFNCYDKVVKYVEMRIVAFNAVNDPQGDRFGNWAKDIKCIGPLDVGAKGSWDFDELFWDENDVIKRLEIVEVKFTFKDNSTVKYTGVDKVDQHWAGTYAKEILKLLGKEDE